MIWLWVLWRFAKTWAVASHFYEVPEVTALDRAPINVILRYGATVFVFFPILLEQM